MTDNLINVIIPCQYSDDDAAWDLCEAPMPATVEYTPPERQTRDYPGTGAGWEVVAIGKCKNGHEITVNNWLAWSEMETRAIHAAQEEAGR